jgi:hypothetical protein
MPEFKAMQMKFLLFRAAKMTQMTSVPANLTAEKSMKKSVFQFTKYHKYTESQMAACAL